MKISVSLLIPAALLLFSCSEPKKTNVVDIRPGAPLFPSASSAQPAAAGAQPGLNPAHGQPGHDCAVPVGAPLPGGAPASQPAAPSLSTSVPSLPAAGPLATPGATPAAAPAAGPIALPSQPTAAPVAVSGKAATGLNPAHGQPGHDCAVPVGAPLNTKGKSAPSPVTSTPVATAAPAAAPSPAPAATAPGTNPPHGQPGHDCAIAVGAPLKKK
ncbi:MAG: hypothetical protein ACO1O1_09170 [Adhaeribacter sp.]